MAIIEQLKIALGNKEAIERYARISYIKEIFQFQKELGLDISLSKRDKYYWNNTFDNLYDMPLKQLRETHQLFHGYVSSLNCIEHE